LAEENRDRGHRRIQRALLDLGHNLARSTISDVLERHGIKPAPQRRRKTTRKEFLKRHWESIVATDFFTVEVWTARGLQRYIILFFSNLSNQTRDRRSLACGARLAGMGRRVAARKASPPPAPAINPSDATVPAMVL
jgi:hypothetical protein